MAFKHFALVALAIAAQALAAPANLSWNSLLGSESEIFPTELDSIRSKSLNTPVIVAELRNALEQTAIFNTVYKNYLAFYNKEASRIEDDESRSEFKKILLDIATHNLEAQKGRKSWTKGVNNFSDMTVSEFKQYFPVFPEVPVTSTASNVSHASLKQFRDVSWKDTATPVKDQGQCGSCYAFGTIALLEHSYNINNGIITDLSEQQIVDCETDTHGCHGGSPQHVVKYLENGVASETDYPYKAVEQTCSNAPAADPYVLSHKNGRSEHDLVSFLSLGPVVIRIALDKGFTQYTGGILAECAGEVKGGHIMEVVGIGSENGQQYYEVKNSWGTKHGEDGYWRMAAGNNCCDIGSWPTRITSN